MKEYNNIKEFFRLFGDGKTRIRWTGWSKACKGYNDYVVVERLSPYEKSVVKSKVFKDTDNQISTIGHDEIDYWIRVEELTTADQRDRNILDMIAKLNTAISNLTMVITDLQRRVIKNEQRIDLRSYEK